jgi:hypothetical protein
MKPLILNLVSLTLACAALTACQPDRPIPQPIMLYRADLGSAEAHDAKDDLQTCRREVNQEAPLTIQPLGLPPIGTVGSPVGTVVLGTVAPPHRVWSSQADYREAIERCLASRGYQIQGWE